MSRAALLVLMLACAGVASPARAQSAATLWWLDPVMQRELHLTTGQVQAIDRIFRSTLDHRRRLRIEKERLEASLARAMTAGNESLALALVDQVATAQVGHARARAHMLWRIYQTLSPAQRSHLLHAQPGSLGSARRTATSARPPAR